MATSRLPLYRRLPEIYRIRDSEQSPPGQLEAYVGVADGVFAAIRDNVEALYHDEFIETCADWVIPYIGDLLGTSHLSGEAWTLRADVARTIHHRRRKGTLGAIESLSFVLSGWAVHAVELRERLCWNQHLNHQRPDAGGAPPLTLVQGIGEPVRGGTVNLRDPASLSLLSGPFDPFAHLVDLKPPGLNGARGDWGGYNVPNLAVFLWRLKAYTVAVSQPHPHPNSANVIVDLTPAAPGNASFGVCFDAHPVGEPMVLFNTHRFTADDDPPALTHPDAVPGPMPAARLTKDPQHPELTPAGRPEQYVQVRIYVPPAAPTEAEEVGLTLYLPQAPFAATPWRYRGANLCAWEAGLRPPLREHEIVVDPERGRILFGVAGANKTVEAQPLLDHLRIGATYGFPGPTGAHPVLRPARPSTWLEQTPVVRLVNFHNDPFGLQHALDNLQNLVQPLIIEIQDSMTHDLDLDLVIGTANAHDPNCFQLANSLWIRAASGERPVIRLARPLRFRPKDPTAALNVKLEGLYLTRAAGFDPNEALIERAALNQLLLEGCTLDPGGAIVLDGTLNGTRAPIRAGMRLTDDHGFNDAGELEAFDQIPEIVVSRSICGPLMVDGDGYTVSIADSVIDAGSGVEETAPALALCATSNPEVNWGAALSISGVTFFGRVRAAEASGRGGIFAHTLEAHDNQKGCIKFSYFAAAGNRLPQHHACVFGGDARLSFTSEIFGAAGYAQLNGRSDPRILEQGPGYDAMGAFGYLQNTHKWKNIHIRYREFMPVGIRPVLILVT
jgi:hypothetical protein